MKKNISKISLSIIISIPFFIASCGKDDEDNTTAVENQPPNAFELVEVINGANEVDLFPSFQWNTASDPENDEVTYSLFLDTDEQPSTLIAENLSSTNFTLSDRLFVLTDYYWKVIAKDSQGNQTESETFHFRTRNLNFPENALVDEASFLARWGHSTLAFENQLWLIAGYTGISRNDIWRSSNGVDWMEVNAEAAFSARRAHASVIFDDKMWVIGGRDGFGKKNDVWYSSDGITWTEATPEAAFSPRDSHKAVVFDGKIWVIAGEDDTSRKNDVWYSTNGVEWVEATSSAPFSVRERFGAMVFRDKVWILGARDGETRKNDIWFSSDGVNWTEATSNAEFSDRSGFASVEFDDKIWVIGGYDVEFKNDIWYSSNGTNWFEATPNAFFPARNRHSSVVFDNKIWVIGGFGGGNLRYNDVWAFD
ncbi:Kelch repeat-containing protein [Costertonia aggregata]|uniref:Fibronectin type-III domain-containing protein n=1 Tax=Costertonia aggregata TaxID=343403 RepID=A0A7H9ARB9_9FLAO|nr:kelch-like protein [Costertonia aggregata]QLG45932.1 hypothetical protein HYG79_11415 [Costertonia aggregata]